MTLDVDPAQPIPLYYQLKTLILEGIAGGTYPPGGKLPTEMELCATYSISRTPVHRALTELADEGVIIRRRRSGSFVNPHWVPRRSNNSEVRVVVTELELAEQLETAAPDDFHLNVATVGFADLHHTLTRAVAEGRAPDIALIDEVWIAEFAAAGFLLPLDELDPDWVSADYAADFVPAFVEGRVIDGHVYAVPEEINVAGLWCRRDGLAAIGRDVPATWDELRSTAAALQAHLPSGHHAIVMPGGHAAGETTSYCLLAVLASNGGRVINQGVRMDSAENLEALRFLRALVDDGSMPGDVVTYDWRRTSHHLGTGKAAIAVGGSYEAAPIANAAGIPLSRVWDEFVFVPFPAGPAGASATVAGGMAYVVFRQSGDPARAMKLLEHLTRTEQLAARALGQPTIPPWKSAIDMVAPGSPFVAETAELFRTAVTRPGLRSYHLVSVQLQNMVEAVLTGRLRPAAAAERAADIIGAITGIPVRH